MVNSVLAVSAWQRIRYLAWDHKGAWRRALIVLPMRGTSPAHSGSGKPAQEVTLVIRLRSHSCQQLSGRSSLTQPRNRPSITRFDRRFLRCRYNYRQGEFTGVKTGLMDTLIPKNTPEIALSGGWRYRMVDLPRKTIKTEVLSSNWGVGPRRQPKEDLSTIGACGGWRRSRGRWPGGSGGVQIVWHYAG